MTPQRKGDPQKETRGTEGPAPEADRDAAEDAREQATVARQTPGEARTTEAKAEGKDTEQDQPAPKRRARRRKAAETEAGEPEAAATAEDAEADAETADAEAGEEPEPERKPRRRRGSAETSAGAAPKPAPRRQADGQVVVRATAKYVRTAPRKARLVIDHIRGKSVDDARAILQHTPRAASHDVLKLLNSAVANAENNHELLADELVIDKAYVDEGPTLKRYRPRAMGRATRIRKRTSHMTITLTTKNES